LHEQKNIIDKKKKKKKKKKESLLIVTSKRFKFNLNDQGSTRRVSHEEGNDSSIRDAKSERTK